MSDFTDLHSHLLAGLDDGPRTWDDALTMCWLAAQEGVRHTVALAHQNERWPVSPEAIRAGGRELAQRLQSADIPLRVFPAAEVEASVEVCEAWAAGRLVSVGDHGRVLLVEMPHGLFVDLRPSVRGLRRLGLRVLLAHPERHPELLQEPGALEELIGLGCLVQVSSKSITDPARPGDTALLRDWFRRGCVHVLGTDAHSPRRRPPRMAQAFTRISEWVGAEAALRICRDNGLALLHGQPLEVPPPEKPRRWWPARLWN